MADRRAARPADPGGTAPAAGSATAAAPAYHEDDEGSGEYLPVDPVELPIGDTLDLHSFRPRDMRDVVLDYLVAARAAGLRDLLIIHGRGAGVQRAAVRALLAADAGVAEFGDAEARAGGATWVRLR